MLPENFAPRTHIVFPQMPGEQLLSYIADELTGQSPTVTNSSQQSVHTIQEALILNAEQGRHAILAIDEAHVLESNALETHPPTLEFRNQQWPSTYSLAGRPWNAASIYRARPQAWKKGWP